MEWRSPSSPRHKTMSISKVKEQIDVGHILRSQGITHKYFIPSGQKVNKEYYVEALFFFQRIRRVRPQFPERGSWFLLQDNAIPHTAV
jgi:hypothetical protein